MRRLATDISIHALGSDLVAMAQCHALDASIFPHPSVPRIRAGELSVWVAKRAGRVVGFVATQVDGSTRAITGIAVAREARGTGVGRALLRAAVTASKGLRAVTLQVSTGNLPAIALYESEGFFVLRTLPRYYSPLAFPNEGDAYAMYLPI